MEKLLLSFLGAGEYREVTHLFGDMSHKATHVQHSLARFFPDHRLLVAMTPASRNRNERFLAGLKYERLDLPTGGLDHQSQLSVVVEAVPADCELVIDVTHGFRHQPILAMAAAQLLTTARGVSVTEVLYAKLDEASSSAPLVSLFDYLVLVRWSNAVAAFKASGNATSLGEELQRVQRMAHTESRAMRPQTFTRFARLAKQLGDEIELNRLVAARQTLEALSSVLTGLRAELEQEREALPMLIVWTQIEGHLEELSRTVSAMDEVSSESRRAGGESEELAFAKALISVHLRYGRLIQAIILAREALVSKRAIALGLDPAQRTHRSQAEASLNEECAALRSQAGSRGGSLRESHAAEDRQAVLESSKLWCEVAEVRNDIGHAGFRPQPLPASKLKDRIIKLCEQTLDFL